MQNAHLRLGRLEYVRHTEVTNTHVWLHVDRYVGDGDQAHLLSVFGGDSEVGRAGVTMPSSSSSTTLVLEQARLWRSQRKACSLIRPG